MRAIPIPDGVAEQVGGRRVVIGDADPTRDDLRPVEYVLTQSAIYPGRPCVHALVELDDEDRARIAVGGRIWLTLDGGEWPWSLTVEEVVPEPAQGRLCGHARQRAASMGVPEAEVLAVLIDPEVDVPAEVHQERERRLASGGRLTVPYVVDDLGCRVAVTVLWRGQDRR